MGKKTHNKRLLILLPGGQPHLLKLWPFTVSFREAPLTGTLLAALVPPELELDVTYVDGSVSRIPLDATFDMVAISPSTCLPASWIAGLSGPGATASNSAWLPNGYASTATPVFPPSGIWPTASTGTA